MQNRLAVIRHGAGRMAELSEEPILVLAISRRPAASMGGTLTVGTTRLGGASFTLRLPLLSEVRVEAPSAKSTSRTRSATLNVGVTKA